jgi:hypothetical protein
VNEARRNIAAKIKLQNSPGDESKIKRNGTTLILINVIVLGRLKISLFLTIVYILK